MSNTAINFLKHILNEVNFILRESKNLEYNDFIQNEKDKRAFTRSFEIIGEAIKNLPRGLRNKYPNVEWKDAAGMRDRLIHAYFDVDYQVLWNAIEHKLPSLKHEIESIIEDLEK